MRYLSVFVLVFISFQASAADIDLKLSKLISTHYLGKLENSNPVSDDIYKLGKSLFSEKLLSGNTNYSCMSCHSPFAGTGDKLPFSVGEGGVAVKRNAPHLYNLGYPKDIKFMFWDGRVSYNPGTRSYRTPEKILNGSEFRDSDIVSKLNGALSAQTIFPILSHDEMRGQRGTNDLADAKTNKEVWEKVVLRLKGKQRYVQMFQKAFPGEKINIGHIGRSLGDFITREFNYNDTPYDRYLGGDTNALTVAQKRGLLLYGGKAKCTSCHNGKHLGGKDFTSAGVPEMSMDNHSMDFGLKETSGRARDQFKFLTKPLRNVALTAPYMHNGAFESLEDVIEHYNSQRSSMKNFKVPTSYLLYYSQNITVDQNVNRNDLRSAQIKEAKIKFGLGLTKSEREDLLEFIKFGLTDYRLQKNLKR